jgi:hypothetical protein
MRLNNVLKVSNTREYTHTKIPPAIHFANFGNKENYHIIETCCINSFLLKMPIIA